MWKCKSCNSSEVETLSWIDLQSGESVGDDEIGEYYCRSCGTTVDIYYEEDEEDINPQPFGDTSVE